MDRQTKALWGQEVSAFNDPVANLVVRVGREEEGVSSLRPDSEAALSQVSRWIGSGPRTTLADDPNADIMTSIIECVR
jgi:hypothetical protein